MSNGTQIQALLNGLQGVDPRVYTLMQLLAQDLQNLNNIVIPLQSSVAAAVADVPIPLVPVDFVYALFPTSVRFNWGPGDDNNRLYEIRKGTDWDTADFIVRTPSIQADINPIAEGPHTFLIKSLNSENEYSEDSLSLLVTVPDIGAVTITSKVIDNNVLLTWTNAVSSFTIDYYRIERDGVEIGRVRGNFTTIFETIAGTFTYRITPVDIAENEGEPTQVIIDVNAPPDFELLDSRISDFSGTKVNVRLQSNGRLLCCINETETFQEHFDNNSWATPQDQVDAGFPIYIQPSEVNGYYEEIIDYGTTLNNVIVNIDWNFVALSGSVTVSGQFEGSLDGVTYDTPQTGTSAFYGQIRYLRLRINFTPATTTSLIEFYNLQILLDVKREVDSGEVFADFEDLNGTEVFFNKTFLDVDSITVSCDSVQPVKPIFVFDDIPNPTSFKVMVFDESGNRVSRLVDWKARGIV